MICLANHREGLEILLDYSSGALDPSRRREVDLHAQNCAECRRLVEAQCTVYSALDEWRAPEVSADFDQRLYARIAADKPSFWQKWLPVVPIVWWKPVVPVALAAVVLSVLFVTRSSNPGPAQHQSGIGKADIEQVEQALDDMDLLAPATPTPSSVM